MLDDEELEELDDGLQGVESDGRMQRQPCMSDSLTRAHLQEGQ